MISYIGGKYRQAKWIASYYPPIMKKYVEVFGGAMWVYINSNLSAEKVYYNDFNPFMANLFACCHEYKEFIPWLEKNKAQDRELFDEFKKEVIDVMDSEEQINFPDFNLASKYVYIVTQCFSGIMSKNVKMVDLKGKYKSKYYSFLDRIRKDKIQQKLDRLVVSNMSYDIFIPKFDNKDTYFYFDPQYYSTENLYVFHNFTINDHEVLAEMLKNMKGKWILSYYEFDKLHEWFPQDKYKWIKKDYKKASMASKGKKQTTGTELLVLNF